MRGWAVFVVDLFSWKDQTPNEVPRRRDDDIWEFNSPPPDWNSIGLAYVVKDGKIKEIVLD